MKIATIENIVDLLFSIIGLQVFPHSNFFATRMANHIFSFAVQAFPQVILTAGAFLGVVVSKSMQRLIAGSSDTALLGETFEEAIGRQITQELEEEAEEALGRRISRINDEPGRVELVPGDAIIRAQQAWREIGMGEVGFKTPITIYAAEIPKAPDRPVHTVQEIPVLCTFKIFSVFDPTQRDRKARKTHKVVRRINVRDMVLQGGSEKLPDFYIQGVTNNLNPRVSLNTLSAEELADLIKNAGEWGKFLGSLLQQTLDESSEIIIGDLGFVVRLSYHIIFHEMNHQHVLSLAQGRVGTHGQDLSLMAYAHFLLETDEGNQLLTSRIGAKNIYKGLRTSDGLRPNKSVMLNILRALAIEQFCDRAGMYQEELARKKGIYRNIFYTDQSDLSDFIALAEEQRTPAVFNYIGYLEDFIVQRRLDLSKNTEVQRARASGFKAFVKALETLYASILETEVTADKPDLFNTEAASDAWAGGFRTWIPFLESEHPDEITSSLSFFEPFIAAIRRENIYMTPDQFAEYYPDRWIINLAMELASAHDILNVERPEEVTPIDDELLLEMLYRDFLFPLPVDWVIEAERERREGNLDAYLLSLGVKTNINELCSRLAHEEASHFLTINTQEPPLTNFEYDFFGDLQLAAAKQDRDGTSGYYSEEHMQNSVPIRVAQEGVTSRAKAGI